MKDTSENNSFLTPVMMFSFAAAGFIGGAAIGEWLMNFTSYAVYLKGILIFLMPVGGAMLGIHIGRKKRINKTEK